MTRNTALLSVSGKDVTSEFKSILPGKECDLLNLVEALCSLVVALRPLLVALIGTSGAGAENS